MNVTTWAFACAAIVMQPLVGQDADAFVQFDAEMHDHDLPMLLPNVNVYFEQAADESSPTANVVG